MKQVTQGELKKRIEAFVFSLPYSQSKGWTSKHCGGVAKTYKEQLWYINNVLKSFDTAQVFFDESHIHIQYPTGSGKILYKDLESDVLFPEIELIVANYGKRFFNVKQHLIAA